ncbi:hypothetical protein GGS23DRAFT_595425 [Durotheca rogersii]|uniref:uncharacterized protein n=1 Tax=Durotheca rogersii TaxID=419775 RepID=UPI00221FEFAE|nr:uncharacterized protein GGS23DRAFT_595425 [Durotheca rogersii]KAI5864717.1 hypothetical protein GGS23DRAFT_595425 [Durotheca rogersii]
MRDECKQLRRDLNRQSMAREGAEMELREQNERLAYLRQTANTELRKRNSELADSRRAVEAGLIENNELKRLREEVEIELGKKSNECESIRKRWKQTARKLGMAKGQSPAFYQITDRELTQLAEQLKYDISNFSISYSETTSREVDSRSDFYRAYLADIVPNKEILKSYLSSETECPGLIQAFMWHVIIEQVFNCALWAGEGRKYILGLQKILRPDEAQEGQPGHQVERKFYQWRATTAALILEALNQTTETTTHPHRPSQTRMYKEYILDQICDTILPQTRDGQSQMKSYREDILEILDEAVALDRDISRQAARVDWFTQSSKLAVFGQESIQLRKGEVVSETQRNITLIIAPAMVKTGRSTGEDFDVKNLLVPMEVSCTPIMPTPTTRSPLSRLSEGCQRTWDFLKGTWDFLKGTSYSLKGISYPSKGEDAS